MNWSVLAGLQRAACLVLPNSWDEGGWNKRNIFIRAFNLCNHKNGFGLTLKTRSDETRTNAIIYGRQMTQQQQLQPKLTGLQGGGETNGGLVCGVQTSQLWMAQTQERSGESSGEASIDSHTLLPTLYILLTTCFNIIPLCLILSHLNCLHI